jgi:hypothetical protein
MRPGAAAVDSAIALLEQKVRRHARSTDTLAALRRMEQPNADAIEAYRKEARHDTTLLDAARAELRALYERPSEG